LYINVGIRKIILKRLFGLNYSNIPFKYAHHFKPQGSHDFRDIENGSLLKAREFKIYDSVEIRASVGMRDAILLKEIVEEDLNSNTFISLVDIDNIQHIYGVGSTEVISHLDMLNIELSTIIEKFRKTNPEANICLFSDHGMVNVSRKVDFQLDQRFGKMNGSFMYFIDSTICRIWVKAKDKKEEILKFLEIQDFGQIIGETERKEYGISNLDYGDIIFRANEGVMFVPNFYGARINKAMHGYSSELESQQAFFSDLSSAVGQGWPKKTVDVHTYLKAVVE
jgi:predicted AlkP superfamily pyrophosphatase or phosphodiesterase